MAEWISRYPRWHEFAWRPDILAARIIGSSDDDLGLAVRERMTTFQVALRDQAHAKGASLRDEVARGS